MILVSQLQSTTTSMSVNGVSNVSSSSEFDYLILNEMGNNTSTVTDSQYLRYVLGPKNIGFELLIPITLVYSLIFVSGILGNVLVCYVIVKNKTMHTATNFYLFSLAISDLISLLLGLPNDIALYWQQYPYLFGQLVCKGRSMVSEMTSYSSVLIIVTFSMERYIAICHPLYSHTLSSLKRVTLIIICNWIIAFVFSVPYALYSRIHFVQRFDEPTNTFRDLKQSAFCALLDEDVHTAYPIYEISSFLFFLFPMTVLVVLYTRMGQSIRRAASVRKTIVRTNCSSFSCDLIEERNTTHHYNNHQPTPPSMYLEVKAGDQQSRGSVSKGGVDHGKSTVNEGLKNEKLVVEERQMLNEGMSKTTDTTVNSPDLNPKRFNDSVPQNVRLRKQNSKRSNTAATASVLRMLVAVVIAFFVCWAPFHTQRLSYVYFKNSNVFRIINEYLYHISGFCYYISATINPILYNVMSANYRRAFKATLFKVQCRCCSKKVEENDRRNVNSEHMRMGYTARSNHRASHPHHRGVTSAIASTCYSIAATTNDVAT